MQNTHRKPSQEKEALTRERVQLLERVQNALELPMIILGFIWLILLLIELLSELSPFLQILNTIIWIVFILDFLLKFILAPKKRLFLRGNVLTAISLFIPALRLFRIGRVLRLMRSVRAVRSLRLVRVLSSLNRGMKSLGASMERRGFGYVLALTLLVALIGAAGILAFEQNEEGSFSSYGEALWWTAMLLTSLGSEYWPKSPEGRALCLILGLYGFAVFGYFTATLATFFIGRDAEDKEAEIAGTKQVDELRKEVIALRRAIQLVRENLQK